MSDTGSHEIHTDEGMTCACRFDPETGELVEGTECAVHADMMRGLREVAALCPDEPEYDDWGGDSERAESWGVAAGHHEAGNIARAAIAKATGESS